ncbi:MAG TPA: DUF6516 family protein [Syntrophales bacterium]|nr:DUF6516 family protein [Syntrophales bacterium]
MSKYLESVERAVRKLEGAYVERYEEEILAVNRINLRIRIRFQTGHILELNEAIIGEKNQIMHIGYRYHFQDRNNSVVFRYDNTPHFQELDTYPRHKHLSERVIAVERPTIIDVIEEAMLLAGETSV